MEYKDYYRTLGVDRNADEKEIKKSYRKLARQYHPDVNPGDKQAEAKFKEINEAYEVLGDPDKRQKYDSLGADWQRWQRAGGDPSGFDWNQWTSGSPGGGRVHVQYGDINDLFGEGAFSDFFQSIFGGRPAYGGDQYAATRAQQGRHVEVAAQITLEEAFRGTQRRVAVDSKRLEVKIPSGVNTGSRVRVAGEGYPGAAGGPPGDMFLVIEVQPHPVFQREKDNLRCEVTVDLYTAILGGEVSVPTIDGRATLRIPPGTQPGQVFRLSGQGMPKLRQPDQRGNLLARAQIRLPDALSEREKQLFEELASLAR